MYYILNYQKNTYTISTWIEYLSSSNASARIVGGYTCGPGEIIYATTEPQIIEKEYSTSVTLIASSDEGYIFLGWYDENGVQAAETESYSFFVTGNVSYIARYAPNTDI